MKTSWEVGDKDDPEQNIWHVKYGQILINANQPEQPLSPIEEIKAQLKDNLSKISDFGECFDRGIKALSEPPSNNESSYKIFPDNYTTLDFHQVLKSC